MKRALLFSTAITGILVGVFSLAYLTTAASNKFPFAGRGIVKANHPATKTMEVHFTHLNAHARELGLGKIVEVSVGQARMFKPGAKNQIFRITQGNVAVGDEVSINGQVRSDDRFVASKVVVRNRSFIITGTLKSYDFPNKQLKVDVKTSSYRPNDLKNGTVTMTFTPDFLIYDGKVRIEPEDLTARDQTVRVEGTVTDNNIFEATLLKENI